jgi:O-antigen/teichoic acid export membrane protein
MLNLFSKFKSLKDYVFTFSVEIIVLSVTLLIYKLVASKLGVSDFTEYAIIKRTIALIIPVVFIGYGVAIPRYIAYNISKGNKDEAIKFFISGSFLVIAITFLFVLIHQVFAGFFSYLYFGSKLYNTIIFPLNTMILGYVLHALVYAYLRGKRLFYSANIIQFMNMAVLPILSIYCFHNLTHVLLFNGLSVLFVSLCCYAFIVIRNYHTFNLFSHNKILLKYGLPRVLGDFALSGFFAFPAYIVTHFYDIETGGYIAFALTLVSMVGSLYSPVSLILLPQVSSHFAQKNFMGIKRIFSIIVLFTALSSIAGITIYLLFTSQILYLYFGDFNEILIIITQLTIIASFGYTLFITLRSIIDAVYVKPLNTMNIIICFIIFILSSVSILYFNNEVNTVLISFAFSMLLLGALSVITLIKFFNKQTYA